MTYPVRYRRAFYWAGWVPHPRRVYRAGESELTPFLAGTRVGDDAGRAGTMPMPDTASILRERGPASTCPRSTPLAAMPVGFTLRDITEAAPFWRRSEVPSRAARRRLHGQPGFAIRLPLRALLVVTCSRARALTGRRFVARPRAPPLAASFRAAVAALEEARARRARYRTREPTSLRPPGAHYAVFSGERNAACRRTPQEEMPRVVLTRRRAICFALRGDAHRLLLLRSAEG